MVKICNDVYTQNDEIYDEHFKIFPFELSDFQKYSIENVVKGNHSLVCVPTGSGKTLPAEFAIKYFTDKGKKVIYCSPIKALSNQKFYDFQQKYPNLEIGLFTGDIKINPNADVLIMTTEILMNTLFKGNRESSIYLSFQINIETELACVVFDEVHYINDKDRGKVWEQSIMMLPKHVQMIMLSATIDSPEIFARWIEDSRNDGKEVALSYNNHRIVPLTHYGFLATTEAPFKTIKDKEIKENLRRNTNKFMELRSAKGVFNDINYNVINKTKGIMDKNRCYMNRKFVLNKLCEKLRDEEMLPAICFVFSRKGVESCAKYITTNLLEFDSKVPYTMKHDCDAIIRKFSNYKEYMELPEYGVLVSLLEKGVGIHHSGMLPVFREIVELMIGKRVIKLLFATESFSIGLDCPIRTAIFSNLSKYDNRGPRYVYAHEYMQCAGRAGRRGIDTVGHVIHCNNLFEIPSTNDYKTILCGMPQSLISNFRITYQLILHLLHTNRDFKEFIEKSMMGLELNDQQKCLDANVKNFESLINNKKQMQFKTSIEDLDKYMKLQLNYEFLNNKKRKEVDREIKTIKDNNKTFTKDLEVFKEIREMEKECELEKCNHLYYKHYIDVQIEITCKLLESHNCIKMDYSDKKYVLTEKGEIASHISEIHSLLGAEMLIEWNFFEEFSTEQILNLLSCFTDIKVEDEYRKDYPICEDEFLKDRVIDIQKTIKLIEEMEDNKKMDSYTNYEEMLQFNLLDKMELWYYADNEQMCKEFIQVHLQEMNISVGDFTKAVLKIVAIVREIILLCENHNQMYCLSKMVNIEQNILKYVATTQSLYI
jgi:superfamily II RNA helicase